MGNVELILVRKGFWGALFYSFTKVIRIYCTTDKSAGRYSRRQNKTKSLHLRRHGADADGGGPTAFRAAEEDGRVGGREKGSMLVVPLK